MRFDNSRTRMSGMGSYYLAVVYIRR